MIRWNLATLDGLEDYTFEINPNQQASPFGARSIKWDFTREGWAGTRVGRTPHAWSFAGVLRSEEQYSSLIEWISKGVKLRLTDDRGDGFIVRLTKFSPTQEGKARNRYAPWRMTYKMEALIFEVEAT